MSQAWNEGYFTDVAYTYGCYRELNPLFQRFCLLAQGLDAPDPGAEGCHAELGFGQGVSFSLHAAATPRFPRGALFALHADNAVSAFDLGLVARRLRLQPACR